MFESDIAIYFIYVIIFSVGFLKYGVIVMSSLKVAIAKKVTEIDKNIAAKRIRLNNLISTINVPFATKHLAANVSLLLPFKKGFEKAVVRTRNQETFLRESGAVELDLLKYKVRIEEAYFAAISMGETLSNALST